MVAAVVDVACGVPCGMIGRCKGMLETYPSVDRLEAILRIIRVSPYCGGALWGFGDRVPSAQRRIAAQCRPPCCCICGGANATAYAIGASNQKRMFAHRERCLKGLGAPTGGPIEVGVEGWWRRCAPSRVAGIFAVFPLAPRNC
jgi:hypothetical protein